MLVVLGGLALVITLLLNWRMSVIYREPLKPSPKGRGYIYFFRGRWESPFFVKIGRAKDVYQRLSQHKTGASPFGVHVVAVIRVKNDVVAEKLIHNRFDREHISTETNGSEWFWYSPRLMYYASRVKDKQLTREVRSKF